MSGINGIIGSWEKPKYIKIMIMGSQLFSDQDHGIIAHGGSWSWDHSFVLVLDRMIITFHRSWSWDHGLDNLGSYIQITMNFDGSPWIVNSDSITFLLSITTKVPYFFISRWKFNFCHFWAKTVWVSENVVFFSDNFFEWVSGF